MVCSAQTVWTGQGSDNNWTTGQNWSGGTAPSSSASTFVRFEGTVRPTPFTDTYAPWILNRIEFESRVQPSAHSFTLSGNQLSFQGTGPEIYCYASAPQTVNNDIEISEAGLTVNGSPSSITLNGQLSGSGAFTVGLNAFLTNSNTYQGVTTIGVLNVAGALTISNGQALGSSENGVVLRGSSQLRLTNNITVVGESLSMGSGSGFYYGLISTSGNNTWTGNIALTFSSGIWSLSPGNVLTVSGNIDGGGNLLQTGGVGDVVFSGAVSNLHWDLNKMGTGSLTLSGTNSNIYQIIIWDGTLVAAKASSLPVSTPIQLNPGSFSSQPAYPTLRVEEDTTIGGLSGYGDTHGGGGTVEMGSHSLTVQQDFFSGYPGAITGTGSLIKTGSGEIALSGVSTYSGGTFINGGALRISGDWALGTPPKIAAVNITLADAELRAANCAQVTLDPRRIILVNGSSTLTALGC